MSEKNDTGTPKRSSGNEVGCDDLLAKRSAKPMHWSHFIWMIPLCVACSPIGVIIVLQTDYKEYWMIPLVGMMLAICASAAEGSPDEPF